MKETDIETDIKTDRLIEETDIETDIKTDTVPSNHQRNWRNLVQYVVFSEGNKSSKKSTVVSKKVKVKKVYIFLLTFL